MNLSPDLERWRHEIEGVRPPVRPRLLRRRLRSPRLRPAQRGRRLRRLPHPLSPLAVRDGLRGAGQDLHLRPVEDLRAGHQQQPRLRVPHEGQRRRRAEGGDGPRVRPRRLLQEQPVVRQDEPPDDRRHGQPRHPRAVLHRPPRRGDRGELHRRLPVPREPHRLPRRLHREAGAEGARVRAARGGRAGGEGPAPPQQGLHGAVHQPARVPGGAEGADGGAREAQEARARGAAAGHPAVPDRTRTARELGARHPRHRAAGGLLLRAARHDEGLERGLGLLLALDDHDPARAHRLRGHRLRGPALGHAWP